MEDNTHTHTHNPRSKKRCVRSHLCISLPRQSSKGSISTPPPHPQHKKSQRDFWWEKCAFLRWWSDRGGVQPNVKDDKWKGAETRSHTQTQHRAGRTQRNTLLLACKRTHADTPGLRLSLPCLKNLSKLTSSIQINWNQDSTLRKIHLSWPI